MISTIPNYIGTNGWAFIQVTTLYAGRNSFLRLHFGAISPE